MKNKKVLALLVSLVMIVAVALPGTLAVSSDQDTADSEFTVANEPVTPTPETTLDASPAPETASPAPETAPPAPETATPAPETQETTGEPEQPIDPENPEQPAEPVLTCTCVPQPAEGEAHKEGCPLAPLSCTCDPAPLEGEEHKEGCPLTCTCVSQPLTGTIHKEGCPLYVAPEAPAVINHIETCLEGCTGEECTCVCHLYEKIMAAETLDEIKAILDTLTDEQWETLSDDQIDTIDNRIGEFNALPVSTMTEEDNSPHAESEIIYPTVSYTYVAPFGAPVTGGQG